MIHITALSRTGNKQPVELKALQFPGGEMHVTVDAKLSADELLITAHLPDSAAVMTLLMVTDALRRAYMGAAISLDMPYVPYARQDRVANAGEALSAKVFCDLINGQRYASVTIQDPHSDVIAALLERVVIDNPLPSLQRALEHVGRPTLVAPDAGARKRALKLANALGVDVVFADKIRDTRTGKITGTQVQGELPDTPLLVVDDICDGGRTFTELADALRARQAAQRISRELYLYVTHGIFSKGLDPLLTRYATVFARNNWTSDSRCALV